MTIQPAILDRLVSARSLLEHSGPPLNPKSDSRAAAQAIVLSQDAAELALRAIADQLSLKGGREITFPQLVDDVQKSTPGLSGPAASYLKRLNDVRVSFKHKGNLPDAGTWYDATVQTMQYLNELCTEVFNIPLAAIDLVHVIQDPHIVKLLEGAKIERENGRFKEALEEIAHAFAAANSSIFPHGLIVWPGRPDAQVALLLSGYGIDASSFIAMQQLLPKHNIIGGVSWNHYEFGHSGNWTDENVRFCLDTVINLMVRLQGAHSRPQPKKFYDVFCHVLTVKVKRPHVTGAHEVTFAGSGGPVVILGHAAELDIGDTIEGQLSPCNEAGRELWAALKKQNGSKSLRQHGSIGNREATRC